MSAEQREAAMRSAAIDRELAQQREEMNRTVKLLLLGAGESGKSTLVKQMKIIHGSTYNQTELMSYKPTICDNLVHSMRAVLEAMGALQINLGSQDNRKHVKAVLSYIEVGATGGLTPDLAEAIKALWSDSGVQECFRRSNEYQLNDSASYFFSEIERISMPNYCPTEQDVLRARVRTTGIIETSFTYKDLVYRMFDVGGQRSERRKWISCFQECDAVIFVVALSGYDMKLYEDQETNRIHESLTLFEAISNNKFFIDTDLILFLNKMDLFAQKIPKSALRKYFPDYTGPDGDVNAAKMFLLEKFRSLNKNPDKMIYHHFTTATNTDNIKHVFDAVSNILIERHLKAAGLG